LVILSTSSQEKIDYLIKETKAYIQGGRFDEADSVMRRSMEEIPIVKKADIYEDIKNFYKIQAVAFEKEAKRNHAIKVYEKLLSMKINDSERNEAKAKLLSLYEQLGKFRESSALERKK
jgi:tetratricopeptide (TPR) repeat protein